MVKKVVKKLTPDQLKENISKFEKEIETLHKTIDPLQKKLTTKWNALKNAQEALSSYVVVDMANMSIDEQIEYALPEDGNSSDMVKYRFSNDLCVSLGFSNSGYNPQTNQRSWKITMTKGSQESYDKTLTSLKLLIPHLKSFEIKNVREGNLRGEINLTGKTIGIFEHTCSEFGVYNMFISDTGKKPYSILTTAYRRTTLMNSFATLEEIVKHIQENIWYDGGKTNSYEEDDDD